METEVAADHSTTHRAASSTTEHLLTPNVRTVEVEKPSHHDGRAESTNLKEYSIDSAHGTATLLTWSDLSI